MKALPQGTAVSFFVRAAGILCIVLLFLIVCLVGTVFVAFIVGRIFSAFFP